MRLLAVVVVAFASGLLPFARASQQPCVAVPSIATLDGATVGVNGPPTLTWLSPAVVGSAFAGFVVDDGAENAHGCIFVSQLENPLEVPTYGATFFPASPIDAYPFKLDSTGASPVMLSLGTVLAASCGTELIVQAAIFDSAAKGGVAFTDGLKITVGGPPSPPPPTIGSEPPPTSSPSVELNGAAPGAATVVVEGPGGSAEAPVIGDSFAVVTPLAPNTINNIFVTAVGPTGATSSPVAIQVVMDAEPPTIAIGFPASGQELSESSVDVVGQVYEFLTPLDGVIVKVNGIPASVDPASGAFAASSVPLDLSGTTILIATAVDSLGNQGQATIGVDYVPIVPGVPTLGLVNGSGQAGPVGQELPIAVTARVEHGDGAPFVGKLVRFEVVASDGGVAAQAGAATATQVLQLATDGAGEATAWWTLGSNAGVASQRLAISSSGVSNDLSVTANAVAAAPVQIQVGSGDDQSAGVGDSLPLPLVVRVTDGQNPIPGIAVSFAVAEGDGSFAGREQVVVTTNSQGRASVAFALGTAPGVNRVHASIAAKGLSNPAIFSARALESKVGAPTRFVGRVVDNSERPIGGAACVLHVGGVTLPEVLSGADGSFAFDEIPAGVAALFVNGLGATSLDGHPIPQGTFPALEFENLVVVPSAVNRLVGPVRLPELDSANARTYDGTSDVELTVAGVPGVTFLVVAGSMTLPDGSVPTAADPAILSLNQVHFDEIPMPLPDGFAAPFAWTLQPGGAAFDPPIAVAFPNFRGLPPGSVVPLQSFNHATGRFESIGFGAVTPNGARIDSTPGSGISLSGWGSAPPPPPPDEDVERCEDDPEIAAQIAALEAQMNAALDNAAKAFADAQVLSQNLLTASGAFLITKMEAEWLILKTAWPLMLASGGALLTTINWGIQLCIITTATPFPLDDPFCAAAIATAAAEAGVFFASFGAVTGSAALLASDVNKLLKAAEALPKIEEGLAWIDVAGSKFLEAQAICAALALEGAAKDAGEALEQKLLEAKAKLTEFQQKAQELKSKADAIKQGIDAMIEKIESTLDELLNFGEGEGGFGGETKTCEIEIAQGVAIVIEIPVELDCDDPILDVPLDPDFLADIEAVLADAQDAHAGAQSVVDDSVAIADGLAQLGDDIEVAQDEYLGLLNYEGWTVSARGVTGSIDSDGSLSIPDVPVSDEPVRVVASREFPPPAIYAESDFFLLEEGAAFELLRSLPVTGSPPVSPVALTVEPEGVTVLASGELSSLQVFGSMNDGSFRALQTLADGTVYFSSNDAIVAVDATGQLSAGEPGVAFVTVSNLGVVAVREVLVANETFATSLAGFVFSVAGAPVRGATVDSEFGGPAITAADGSFNLPLTLPTGTENVNLVVSSGSSVAVASVDKLQAEGMTDAGIIYLGMTAPTNVALAKAVSAAQGGVNGAPIATLVNGGFLPKNTHWQTNTIWWTGSTPVLEVDLGGEFVLFGLIVQADDNDAYLLEYWSASLGSWEVLWNVPNYDSFGSGMQTRPDPFDDTEQFLLSSPKSTNRLRIRSGVGDGSYSVSELQAWGLPASTP